MAVNALVAEVRDATGKGVARKLRAAGRIPAVVYGRRAESKAISVTLMGGLPFTRPGEKPMLKGVDDSSPVPIWMTFRHSTIRSRWFTEGTVIS